MSRWLSWLFAAGLCAISMSAWAGAEDVDRAKDYFSAGAQAYAVGKYDAAIQAFEQAYKLAPRSAILFSMAQALRRQYFIDRDSRTLQRAIKLFRQYVDEVEQGGRRADAVQALSELEPMAARLAPEAGSDPIARELPVAMPTRMLVSSPTPGARISIDGGEPGEAPYIEELEPGKHTVKVTAPGFFPEERVEVAVENVLVTVPVTLRELPGRLQVEAPEGVAVHVDGRFQGNTPLGRPLELPSGKHVVSVTRKGYVGHVQEVNLQRGKTTTLQTSLRASVQRNVSLVMLGASGVALVVSAGFAGQAMERQQAAQDVLDRRDEGNISAEDVDVYDAARRDRDGLRRAAIVVLSTSAVLGAVGGMLYAFDTSHLPEQTRSGPAPHRPPKRRAPAPSAPATLFGGVEPTPLLAPGFAGGALTGHF